ncbi:MAG TPA: hypothetical protein VH143_20595 [Kofleriaceae bacterium]|jgi:hypothetical protein|nr:hypothetical protein [Kofleriaceae bacterium]
MKLAVVALGLAACWTNAPEPMTPVASEPRTPPPAPSRASRWVGTYVCPQGRTAVTITIEHRCTKTVHGNCAIDGVFEFGPSPDSPRVPHGSYRYEGTVTFAVTGEILVAARPLEWIEQPTGYVPVGFVATSDPDRRAMHGRIVEPQCGEIELRRSGPR